MDIPNTNNPGGIPPKNDSPNPSGTSPITPPVGQPPSPLSPESHSEHSSSTPFGLGSSHDTSTTAPHSAAKPPSPHHGGLPFPLIILLIIVSFLGGLLIAAWYFQNQFQQMNNAKSTPPEAQAVKIQTLTIGTDATFQPMEFTNPEGGLIGYDVDLGYRIGSELGAKVIYKNIPWDNLFTALDQKEVDAIISGVTITDERKQKYDFSDSYLNAGQVIITRRDTTDITSAATIKGKRIAVQAGTTGETEALKLTTKELVISYPDYVQATEALVAGKVDAVLSDLPAAKGVITENPTLQIASDPLTSEYYGIVFRKGDANVKRVNEILTSLRVKGILTDLKQKWLD